VCRFLEAIEELEQDEAPHGLIDGRVSAVVLLDDHVPQVRWDAV
jgi:hypothetical protein